jgi:hypothetical protein
MAWRIRVLTRLMLKHARIQLKSGRVLERHIRTRVASDTA